MVLDLERQVAAQNVEELAAGQVCRPEDLAEVPLPRVSSSVSSIGELLDALGKWPQKMIMYDQMLRIRLAVRLPAKTHGANGPASSGNAT